MKKGVAAVDVDVVDDVVDIAVRGGCLRKSYWRSIDDVVVVLLLLQSLLCCC